MLRPFHDKPIRRIRPCEQSGGAFGIHCGKIGGIAEIKNVKLAANAAASLNAEFSFLRGTKIFASFGNSDCTVSLP